MLRSSKTNHRRTITRRIEKNSKDVRLSQINQLDSLEYLSICLNESTDASVWNTYSRRFE